MVVVKVNALSFLAIPLNEKLFGANKTWRGFAVMPLCGVLGLVLTQQLLLLQSDFVVLNLPLTQTLLLGLFLGFAYVLFELPNSYLKRKFGIKPGQLAKDRSQRRLFFVLDHVDSLIGCVLVYFIFLGFRSDILFCVLIAPSVHVSVNLLLWLARIRKQPF